jgi:hypothetical protein
VVCPDQHNDFFEWRIVTTLLLPVCHYPRGMAQVLLHEHILIHVDLVCITVEHGPLPASTAVSDLSGGPP